MASSPWPNKKLLEQSSRAEPTQNFFQGFDMKICRQHPYSLQKMFVADNFWVAALEVDTSKIYIRCIVQARAKASYHLGYTCVEESREAQKLAIRQIIG
jgi:hypothetical protein